MSRIQLDLTPRSNIRTVVDRLEAAAKVSSNHTLVTAFILLLVLKIEQNLVLLSATSSPKALLESLDFPQLIVVYLLSPLLHSGPNHLTDNLFIFMIFGVILEQRSDLLQFATFIMGVGIIANVFAPYCVLLAGYSVGMGIGLSGVTHAMVVREAIYRFSILTDKELSNWIDAGILILALIFSYLSISVLIQGNTPPHASEVAHTTGLILGAIWGVVEVRN